MVDTRAHTSGIDVGVFVTTVLEDIGDNGDNNIPLIILDTDGCGQDVRPVNF